MTTILIDKNIMVPMHDGVRLATDVYRLGDAAPIRVLMARTPYLPGGKDCVHALQPTGIGPCCASLDSKSHAPRSRSGRPK